MGLTARELSLRSEFEQRAWVSLMTKQISCFNQNAESFSWFHPLVIKAVYRTQSITDVRPINTPTEVQVHRAFMCSYQLANTHWQRVGSGNYTHGSQEKRNLIIAPEAADTNFLGAFSRSEWLHKLLPSHDDNFFGLVLHLPSINYKVFKWTSITATSSAVIVFAPTPGTFDEVKL